MSHFADDETLTHIAALELEVARLRSVMADVIKAHGYAGGTPIEVMSTQFIPTALPELIEKVEKMTIERCATAVGLEDSYQDDGFKAKCKAVEQIHDLPTGQIKLEELL